MLEEQYKFIPNFLDEKTLNHLNTKFKENLMTARASFDESTVVGRSYNIYNFLPAVNVLCQKTSIVSKLIDEDVLPTYAFIRRYCNGSKLQEHKDRRSCEISLTINLDSDLSWEFKLRKNDEIVSLTQNPGDAILYIGCDLSHFRESYNGSYYDQLFLHYVRYDGPNADTFFDLDNIRMTIFKMMNNINKQKT